jgi:hypothetical protein
VTLLRIYTDLNSTSMFNRAHKKDEIDESMCRVGGKKNEIVVRIGHAHL